MGLFFEHETDTRGVTLRLLEKPWVGRAKAIPVDTWADRMADQAFTGVSRVLALLEADDSVGRTGDSVFLDHVTIASLSEPQALGLGFPPSIKAALQIETKNLITEPDFRILHRWIGLGNRVMRVVRTGALLSVDGVNYRLPEPLFGLVEGIDEFAGGNTADESARMAKLARLQALMPEETQAQLSIDKYFSSFRVLHATAFSLNLQTDGRSFDFDPILFGRRVVTRTGPPEDIPVSEAEGLLTEHQQSIFARERFRSSQTSKPSYVIESGVYVYLDPSLQKAMAIVRLMQRADAETRKRFAQAPQLYMKEALSESLDDDAIETLFIETEQYSARVVDVGVWTAPVLPWIKKDPNDWLPEKFGLRIGEQYVSLTPEELGPLREQIHQAIEAGEPFVEFGPDHTRIPATTEAEQSVAELLSVARPILQDDETRTTIEQPPTEEGVTERRVLIVQENFERLDFKRVVKSRPDVEANLPAAVRSTLKKHQLIGLGWLQMTWRQGYPGVLLADDMGLGKTLQALSFLAWLREIGRGARSSGVPKGPMLIVSPTGLLANWENEHNFHLHEPGLGEICRAYGRHLKLLKTTSARELDRGAPSLDHRRIQQADLVLTTYETLRDYHLSFAAIPFGCVVFDEMQKVKSPTSLLTRAAKTVNANYALGLTGTPIENQLTDFWCIMDIVNPGNLGDLKSFSERYRPDDEAALEELHARMLKASPTSPAPMLRRMKNDELEGLPRKVIHIRRRPMPEEQARVYEELVTRAKQPNAGPMLETLHMLRGISLHPIWPPAGEIADERSFISQSARLSETFAILDEIATKKEKVLIFLESLDLQEHLALMIKRRYGLKQRPMQINGTVAGERRQKFVDQFQSERGTFDVMILSPRAGGVGLTLTAANHVIHLSRWWNPAVEDQCTDRVYRIGQLQTVNVYYPLAVHPLYENSSFDELLNALLARKRKLSDRMLLPPINLETDQKWFAESLGRTKPETSVTALDEIDRMEPGAFERWALSQCARLGWEAARTPKSHDGGADGVIVHRVSAARVIIQCKHKQADSSVCDDEAVDDLLRARANYTADARLIALTNAQRFSSKAIERAERYGVLLIGRSELTRWPSQLMS